MKFKRIGITAGLIICLVGVNIQGTFGLENEEVVSDQTQMDMQTAGNPDSLVAGEESTGAADSDAENVPDPGIENGESGSVNAGQGDDNISDDEDNVNKGEGSDQNGGKDQSTDADQNDGKDQNVDTDQNDGKDQNADADQNDGKDQNADADQNDGKDGNSDANQNGGKDQNTDADQNDGKVPSTDADQNHGPVNEDGSKDHASNTERPDDQQNTGADGDSSQDSGQNEEESQEESQSGRNDNDGIVQTTPQEDDSEEALNYGSDGVIVDDSPDAVYTGNIYPHSDAFIDNRDKIKYNAALPIEGLPSFITQEMVIGALKCQDETGYPASVTIAQIIQESGFGTYGPEGEQGMGLSYLAFQYNNLFGIKGTGPAGSVDMRTGEQTSSGETYMTTAGFRVYNTYTECIEDRTELLKEVYSDLTEGVTDANTFAMKIGIRWATDIRYAQSLIRQMETYDLYRLDRMTLRTFSDMIGIFADPCPGASITSQFGMREFRNSFHKGIDLGTGIYNIPTYAADAGTVIVADFSESAGNWVVIDHGNGLVTKYMHHDKLYVEKGQHVEKGQQIGLSGTTGDSTGNHLHFQVEENGTAVDPVVYLGLEK